MDEENKDKKVDVQQEVSTINDTLFGTKKEDPKPEVKDLPKEDEVAANAMANVLFGKPKVEVKKEEPQVEVKKEEPQVEVKFEEVKPEVKEEPKPEVKEEPKPEVKEEPKPEVVKEEIKPEVVKEVIKEEPKVVIKQEPKVVQKEEPKPEVVQEVAKEVIKEEKKEELVNPESKPEYVKTPEQKKEEQIPLEEGKMPDATSTEKKEGFDIIDAVGLGALGAGVTMGISGAANGIADLSKSTMDGISNVVDFDKIKNYADFDKAMGAMGMSKLANSMDFQKMKDSMDFDNFKKYADLNKLGEALKYEKIAEALKYENIKNSLSEIDVKQMYHDIKDLDAKKIAEKDQVMKAKIDAEIEKLKIKTNKWKNNQTYKKYNEAFSKYEKKFLAKDLHKPTTFAKGFYGVLTGCFFVIFGWFLGLAEKGVDITPFCQREFVSKIETGYQEMFKNWNDLQLGYVFLGGPDLNDGSGLNVLQNVEEEDYYVTSESQSTSQFNLYHYTLPTIMSNNRTLTSEGADWAGQISELTFSNDERDEAIYRLPHHYYLFKIESFFKVEKAGLYNFAVETSEGIKLRVNGNTIIDTTKRVMNQKVKVIDGEETVLQGIQLSANQLNTLEVMVINNKILHNDVKTLNLVYAGPDTNNRYQLIDGFTELPSVSNHVAQFKSVSE